MTKTFQISQKRANSDRRCDPVARPILESKDTTNTDFKNDKQN